MPLVKYRPLRSYDRLEQEGIDIRSLDEVQNSDQPEIHIGFLNMMPDKAFLATERQFIRLVAAGSAYGNIYVRPFSAGGMSREPDIRNYISQCYESFSQIRSESIHALVLTGANPVRANLGRRRLLARICRSGELGPAKCHIQSMLMSGNSRGGPFVLWNRANSLHTRQALGCVFT